jgi:hypothetical protein
VTHRYRPPRLLEANDLIDDFECRSTEQTEWLRFHARQAHTAGTAKVLVVTPVDGDAVVAYYAWSMASISVEDAPARVRQVRAATLNRSLCWPASGWRSNTKAEGSAQVSSPT